MNVLVAVDIPNRTGHALDMLRDHFSHISELTLIVAYPSDNPDYEVGEYETEIDRWRDANENIPVHNRRVEGHGYRERLLTVIEQDNIDHLVIGPQDSSFRQRIFGNAPSPMFTECPVPITVTAE